jgi:oligopeptide transport system substrate-binding protein
LKRKREDIMGKKVISLLLVLVLIIASFTACTQNNNHSAPDNDKAGEKAESNEKTPVKEETKEPQKLTYNLAADPETLDPQLNSTVGGSVILSNTFEGLVTFDKDLKPVPGVAESWTISDDGLVWTFKLREDAKWSDGKPVTSEDFVYAWRRAVDPKVPCDYSYMFDLFENGTAAYTSEVPPKELGVRAIDEKTLEVTLKAAASYMVEVFGFPTLFPVRKDIIEQDPEGWAFNPELAISNGPFKLSSYTQNDVLTVVPNEHYWDRDRVKLDELNFVFIVEQSTALSAMEAGDLDGIDEVPNQEIPRLQSESEDFIIAPYLGVYYYVFNLTKEPFDDVRVRKAFSKAIDRNAIVTTVTLGGQVPATGYVPSGVTFGGEDFREAGGDFGMDPMSAQVEEAKKLLADAGYPNGEGLPKITLQYNTSENHKRIAEAIQEMWNENLNTSVELTNMETRVHYPALEEGNFQIARAGWIGDYNHPMTFLDLLLSDSGNNYTQVRNEEFDKIINEAKMASDEKTAKELMHKAENIIMENQMVIPIYYYTLPMMMGQHVKGWYRSPLGQIYFKNTYIEK